MNRLEEKKKIPKDVLNYEVRTCSPPNICSSLQNDPFCYITPVTHCNMGGDKECIAPIVLL